MQKTKPVFNILELCLSNSFGGLELYFANTCEWFGLTANSLVCVVRPHSRLSQHLRKKNIDIVELAQPQLKFYPNQKAKAIARLIDEHQIDILHVHYTADLPLAVLAIKKSKKKCKLVHMRHMDLPHTKKDLYHRYIYQNIDLFIAITDLLQQQAKERLPIAKHKIKRLYHGTKTTIPDTELKDSFIKKEKNAHPKAMSIGLFSRIKHQKGQHLVIEAAYLLKQKGIALQIFIIGEFFDKIYINGLKEIINNYDLKETVYWIGFYENPVSIMPDFDVVILPSYQETFGLVLIEAMQAGVAVIGSNAGGVPEIIDHQKTGLLFEPGNAKDLAAQIELLYKDPALRVKMANEGKHKAHKHFDIKKHYQKLEQMMLEVINCSK